MAFDVHKNFAISTVATAPSPAASGTSLVVAAGEGTRFPTVPFNATVWPAGVIPTPANAEIVRVTAISTDTLTITRAQESSSARTIVVGDQIAATITKKTLTDMESQGLRQSFRGLELGTHPDSDVVQSKVALLKADEIVMHDGESVTSWGGDSGPLVADITVSGAGGLDTGSEGASRWYEIYAIRKSTDGTKNLLLHRAKSFDLDQSQTTDDGTGSSPALRYDSTLERLGQSFAAGLSGALAFIDVKVSKSGSPTGNCWWTLEADSSGSPSGTALATSDKFDVSLMAAATNVLRVPFRTPYTLVASTTYWLVMRGDYTTSTSNYVVWLQKASGNPYASGTAKTYNGSTWATSTNKDQYFKTYVVQNDTAVTMPSGYDQRALIGYVYNDASSNFRRFRQLGGRVDFNRTQLGSYTTTTLTLTDLSAWLPPRTCEWLVSAVSDTANAQLWIAPVPEGFESGYYYYQSSPVSAAGMLAMPMPVATSYQAVYLAVSAGTGTPRCMGFRWA